MDVDEAGSDISSVSGQLTSTLSNIFADLADVPAIDRNVGADWIGARPVEYQTSANYQVMRHRASLLRIAM